MICDLNLTLVFSINVKKWGKPKYIRTRMKMRQIREERRNGRTKSKRAKTQNIPFKKGCSIHLVTPVSIGNKRSASLVFFRLLFVLSRIEDCNHARDRSSGKGAEEQGKIHPPKNKEYNIFKEERRANLK